MRGRALLIVGVAVGLMVLGLSLAGGGGSSALGLEPSPYRPDALDARGGTVECRSVPTRLGKACRTVDVDGTVVRYALISNEGAASKDAVLLDLGGPGVASLGPAGALGLLPFVREAVGSRPLLVLEEPWVTAPESEACWRAGRAYVEAVLGGRSGPPDLIEACGAKGFGWTKRRYAKTVRAILAEHDLTLEGFIGVSFGSVRLSYLDVQPEWVVLNSPYPSELSLQEVIQHQSASVERTAKSLATLAPEVDTRTAHAAALGLIEVPEGDLKAAVGKLRQLAGAAVGVYGLGELSLGRLAFFEEFCPIGGPPPEGSEGPAHALFTALFGPCRGRTQTPWTVRLPRRTCIVYSESDLQIPPPAVKRWAEKLGVSAVAAKGAPHGAYELFEACLHVAEGGEPKGVRSAPSLGS